LIEITGLSVSAEFALIIIIILHRNMDDFQSNCYIVVPKETIIFKNLMLP